MGLTVKSSAVAGDKNRPRGPDGVMSSGALDKV